jgi:hypothetical protein
VRKLNGALAANGRTARRGLGARAQNAWKTCEVMCLRGGLTLKVSGGQRRHSHPEASRTWPAVDRPLDRRVRRLRGNCTAWSRATPRCRIDPAAETQTLLEDLLRCLDTKHDCHCIASQALLPPLKPPMRHSMRAPAGSLAAEGRTAHVACSLSDGTRTPGRPLAANGRTARTARGMWPW